MIGTAENLFQKINEMASVKSLNITTNSFAEVDQLLAKLKTPAQATALSELRYLETCQSALRILQSETDLIHSSYEKFYVEFTDFSKDVDKIAKILLNELLKTGQNVLHKKHHKDETCPLCLQSKSQVELLQEIQRRLTEIAQVSNLKAAFESAKQSLTNLVNGRIVRVNTLSADDYLAEPKHADIKEALENLKSKLSQFIDASNETVTSGNSIPQPNSLEITSSNFTFLSSLDAKITALKDLLKEDNNAVAYSNISAARDAFLLVERFGQDREKLQAQKASLEAVYNEFVRIQKENLENFINQFSEKINEYYQFMNPGEQFQELRIVTIGEEDELNGITIEYKYHGAWVSPPQKYFSESHLNCFGLSFFLASVQAFNKENRFFLLDDVISSFDSSHRKRFADLIFEKFSDYQVILLTHEAEWYQYVSRLAKRKGWHINQILFSDSEGTYLEDAHSEVKNVIETALANGQIDFLGNPIRKYLEQALKEICFNLEVKVSFRFNEVNEKRMPDELLTALLTKIEKASQELKTQAPIIHRLMNSSILGNLLSHDNPFTPKLGDLKAFWSDIIEMEKLFYCDKPDCTKPMVSVRNYDSVARKIRCGCDGKKYDWKK